MMNKKGFSTMSFVIAMLIFSGIIGLYVLAVGSLAEDYGNDHVVSEEFASKFDTFENDTARSGEMWDAVTGEGGLSIIGVSEILFFSTFRVISLVFNGVVEAGRTLFSFGGFFDIPYNVAFIVFTLIFSILTVIIIFKVISFVKGGKDL